jgi:cytochrome c oxidase subunit II
MADRIRWTRGALLAALFPLIVFILAGCSITGGELQSANVTRGDNAETIWNLFVPIFWLSVVVFVMVQGILIWAVIRFRRKPDSPTPPAIHGNTRLEIAWTIVPALILAVILVPTVMTIADLADEPDDPYVIEVVGFQWWWGFNYVDEEFTTANVLHIPVGQPIELRMTSVDVIHSFYASQLFGKQDVIPGRENYIFFTAQEPGEYWGQCYEFCGLQHANMKFRVVVHEQGDFQAWVERQVAGAPEPEPDTLEARGKEVFFEAACFACHAIDGAEHDGLEAVGVVGPNLTNIGERQIIGAGVLDNTPENMRAWIRNPDDPKPGALMPPHPPQRISDEDLDALVAYLESLQ